MAKIVKGCPWWMAAYGINIQFDGTILPVGTVIECRSRPNVICSEKKPPFGQIVAHPQTGEPILRFVPIYGFDQYETSGVTGPKDGDTVHVFVNGKHCAETFAWHFGDLHRLESLTTAPEPIHGDLNGDGVVDISDLMCLIEYLRDDTQNFWSVESADLNHDGIVDISDFMTFGDFIIFGIPLP